MQTKLSTDADHYYLSYVNPLWVGTLGLSWVQVGTGTVEKVPAKLRVGIAYAMQSRGKLALDLAQTIRSGYDTALSAGYEWTNEALALRLGYNNGITAGAGFVSGVVQHPPRVTGRSLVVD